MDYRDEVYFDSQPENEAPFTAEEFASRLERVRRKMDEAKVDMLYVMAPESMYYLRATKPSGTKPSPRRSGPLAQQSPSIAIMTITFSSTASVKRCLAEYSLGRRMCGISPGKRCVAVRNSSPPSSRTKAG